MATEHVEREKSPNSNVPESTASTDLAAAFADHPLLQPGKGIVFTGFPVKDGPLSLFGRLHQAISKPVTPDTALQELAFLRQWAGIEEADFGRKTRSELHYEHAQSGVARLVLLEQANAFIEDEGSFMEGKAAVAEVATQSRPYWTEAEQEHVKGLTDFVLKSAGSVLGFLEWKRHDVVSDQHFDDLLSALHRYPPLRGRTGRWRPGWTRTPKKRTAASSS